MTLIMPKAIVGRGLFRISVSHVQGAIIYSGVKEFMRIVSCKKKKAHKHWKKSHRNAKSIRFTMFATAVTCFLFASLLSFALATNEVQFIFNNGFTTSSGASCTSTEMSRINAIFTARRLLRGSGVDNTTAVVPRQLATYARECANLCAGYATGTCTKKGCVGYRELAATMDNEGDRTLQISCPTEIAELHTKLDAVMNQATTSTSCKNWMAKSKRRATCFPDFTYGNVIGIRLWKISGTSQTAMTGIVSPGGTVSFCKSLSINIEAIVEPCVKNAHFEMSGPSSYFHDHDESIAPFSIFGDDGTVLRSRSLAAVGTYSLWVAPDYDVFKDQKKKTFNVVVNNC
jgi:hypothetical protein